eukprot:13636300-Alexandrium_andersonii.AAC.1
MQRSAGAATGPVTRGGSQHAMLSRGPVPEGCTLQRSAGAATGPVTRGSSEHTMLSRRAPPGM